MTARDMQAAACDGCGAGLEYAPGTTTLRCPYCGRQQEIAPPSRPVYEHSFATLAHKPRVPVERVAAQRFVCGKCGAKTLGAVLAQRCQFCAAPLVVDTTTDPQVPPEAVLPFAFDRDGARAAFRKWVKSRWFAPNNLKRMMDTESMRSTYLPYWTFDSQTESFYKGARGTYYYTTQTYTDSQGRTQTRQVRHTLWTPASGTVARAFDDVLIPATTIVAPDRLAKLDPWPLKQAVPYDPNYLLGYQALRYDVEPESGFEQAKAIMARQIEKDCLRDIGGNEQRLSSVKTKYSRVTFKLVLLPVWIGAYVYGGEPYQILINGITGEVQGARPYSAAKIIAAVVAVIVVIAVLAYLHVTYN